MSTPPPVVVATDLSEASDHALVRGSAHAGAVGAALVVCHVVPDVMRHHPLLPDRGESDAVASADLTRRAAELVTEQVRRVLGTSPDDYTVIIETGDAEDEIVRVVEERRASLVVVGGKPRAGLERVIGHVAERVVRYAHTSVLVARPGPHTGKVLVATDFSDDATPALQFASMLTKAGLAQVTVLHVTQHPSTLFASIASPLGSPWTPPAKSAMDQLDTLGRQAVEGLASQYGFAFAEQIEGDPAEVMVSRAGAMDAEMIIMGSRGRTGLARLLLGSTAEKVIRASNVSVLVARKA